jgi:hypothetical protein
VKTAQVETEITEKFVIKNLEIPPVLLNKDIINGIVMSSPDELDAELLVRAFSSSDPKDIAGHAS